MRGGVHCLLPSAYRRHATRSMREGLTLLNDTPQMQAHVSAPTCPPPLMKSEGTYTGAVVGGENTSHLCWWRAGRQVSSCCTLRRPNEGTRKSKVSGSF